jgi:hypothetical protein
MTKRTSKAAIASLAVGCIALVSWVSAVVLGYIFPPPPGHGSPAVGPAGPVFIVLMLLSGVLAPVVLVTAIVAVFSVRRSGGTRKGILMALLGLVLAAAPYALSGVLGLIVRNPR